MTSQSKISRPVHGIVIVDKPAGFTSNRVLQRVKRLFAAQKAGHTGSLDPAATGMLPICLGTATKVSGQLLHARKTYRVVAELGIATDTGDADGRQIEQRDSDPIDAGRIRDAIGALLGPGRQTPPMYSALKVGGRRLYELAREGRDVERAARPITVYEISVAWIDWPRFEVELSCSKGTYVRTLVTDIAASLGTVGHVVSLRRLAVGPYDETQMRSLETLEGMREEGLEALDSCLLGADSALTELPAVTLAAEGSEKICHGQRIRLEEPAEEGRVRIYGPAARFLGIGEIDAAGELKPRRLFVA